MPNGIPRYVRCYKSKDDVADPYTVVFTGNYNNIGRDSRSERGWRQSTHLFLSMGANPFHPQGVGQHGESDHLIDYPTYGELGKKIKFEELPEDCQKLVLQDYRDIWEIKE